MINFTNLDLAWAAGIVDGDGCINIHRQKPGKNRISNTYHLNLRVCMCHEPTITRFHQIAGVGWSGPRKTKDCYKPQFIHECSSHQAYEFLKRLEPFIFTKKEEMEIIHKFMSIKNPINKFATITPIDIISDREDCFQKMRKLHPYKNRIP